MRGLEYEDRLRARMFQLSGLLKSRGSYGLEYAIIMFEDGADWNLLISGIYREAGDYGKADAYLKAAAENQKRAEILHQKLQEARMGNTG